MYGFSLIFSEVPIGVAIVVFAKELSKQVIF
jgi:hypothetical protein